jgi:hypothetical protein
VTTAKSLLAKHENKPPPRCVGCQEPHRKKFDAILDEAIKTQQRVTIKQLWMALVEWSDYPMGANALRLHLGGHCRERFKRINLARRGPIG